MKTLFPFSIVSIIFLTSFIYPSGVNKSCDKEFKKIHPQQCTVKFYLESNTSVQSISIPGVASFSNPSAGLLGTYTLSGSDIVITTLLPSTHPAVRYRIRCSTTNIYCSNVVANGPTVDEVDISQPCQSICQSIYISVQTGVSCP